MVTELIIVWVLGVVAFFVLWAILLKVIKRISERKQKDEIHVENADSIEPKPEQHIWLPITPLGFPSPVGTE